MNHLSGVLTKPVSLQNGAQAMRDYIEIIETEAEKRRLAGESEELLAMKVFEDAPPGEEVSIQKHRRDTAPYPVDRAKFVEGRYGNGNTSENIK